MTLMASPSGKGCFEKEWRAQNQARAWPNNMPFPLFNKLGYFPQQSYGTIKVALLAKYRRKTNALVPPKLTHRQAFAVTLTQANTSLTAVPRQASLVQIA